MTLELEDTMKKELQKLHSIEQHLVDALKMLEQLAQKSELKSALASHRAETEVHVQRIEQVCSKMGWQPIGVPSQVVQAMAKETVESIGGAEPSPLTDAMVIAAAQKSEHLEIASYSSVISLAAAMGQIEAAELLRQSLEEEKKADEKLTQLAESGINQSAVTID